jgi:hypothetical protein
MRHKAVHRLQREFDEFRVEHNEGAFQKVGMCVKLLKLIDRQSVPHWMILPMDFFKKCDGPTSFGHRRTQR